MFQDAKQRSMAIGVWIGAFSAGSAIGPLLGGLLLEHFWWGSVFFLALPVMGLLLVLGPIVLPEYRDPDAARLDLASAAMSLAAVLTIIFGVKQIAQDGISVLSIASVLIGLAVGALFIRRQFRLPHPMIDLSLFRIPAFSVSLVVNLLSLLVFVGYFLVEAQYLQLVLALSPLQAGIWSLPSAIAFVVGSQMGPRIVRRVRPAYLIGAALGLASVGLVVLTQVEASSGLGPIVAASVLVSLGLAPVFGLTTELIVGSAPPERAGAASGISETSAELAGTLGISILGSIGLAIYRSGVADAVPSSVPADAAAAARDTLGAAVAVAAQLPAQLGSSVLQVARDAFVSGMHTTSMIATILAVGVAVLSAVMLRGVQTASGEEAVADVRTAAKPSEAARHDLLSAGTTVGL